LVVVVNSVGDAGLFVSLLALYCSKFALNCMLLSMFSFGNNFHVSYTVVYVNYNYVCCVSAFYAKISQYLYGRSLNYHLVESFMC